MARRQSTGSRNRSPDGRCGLTKTPATGPTKAKGQQEEDGAKGDGARGGVHAKGHLAEDGEARQQIAEMLSRVASQSLRKAGMSRAWGAPEGAILVFQLHVIRGKISWYTLAVSEQISRGENKHVDTKIFVERALRHGILFMVWREAQSQVNRRMPFSLLL